MHVAAAMMLRQYCGNGNGRCSAAAHATPTHPSTYPPVTNHLLNATVLCAMPCRTVPCRAVPCRATTRCRAVPCRATPNHTGRYAAVDAWCVVQLAIVADAAMETRPLAVSGGNSETAVPVTAAEKRREREKARERTRRRQEKARVRRWTIVETLREEALFKRRVEQHSEALQERWPALFTPLAVDDASGSGGASGGATGDAASGGATGGATGDAGVSGVSGGGDATLATARRVRHCSVCRATDHDKRRCPLRDAAAGQALP